MYVARMSRSQSFAPEVSVSDMKIQHQDLPLTRNKMGLNPSLLKSRSPTSAGTACDDAACGNVKSQSFAPEVPQAIQLTRISSLVKRISSEPAFGIHPPLRSPRPPR